MLRLYKIFFLLCIYLHFNTINASDFLYFGMSGPTEGPTGFLGRSVSLGINIAFDEFNSKQDYRGKKLRLVTLNDNYEQFYAKQNIMKFANDDRMLGVIGSIGSPTSEAVLPIIEEKKILYFGAYSGSPALRDSNYRYVLNYRASYIDEINNVLNGLFSNNISIDNFAIFTQDASNFDNKESRYVDILKSISSLRKDITPEELDSIPYAFYFRNTDYVDGAVKEILDRDKDIKVFILSGTSIPITKFIKKMKEFYPQAYYFVLSFSSAEGLIDGLCNANNILCEEYSRRVVITQVVPYVYQKNNKLTINFNNSFNNYINKTSDEDKQKMEKFELIPNSIAFEGYINAKIIIQALLTMNPKQELNRESLIDAIQNLGNFLLDDSLELDITGNMNSFSNKVWMTSIHSKQQVPFNIDILKSFEEFKSSWKVFVEDES